MKINSATVWVSASDATIYSFFSDLRNLIQLLPQDRISEWQATESSCSFKIQSAATIELIFREGTPNSLLILDAGPKSPFPFELRVHITADGNQSCSGHLAFDGNVNPFIRMMVEKPLTNLFNHMAEKLKEIHAA
jgi:hypothetical protein